MAKKLRSYFSPFVDQTLPEYVSRRERDCRLQSRFPIVEILFLSGDIRDRMRSRPKSRQKACFSAPNFLRGGPQILDQVFKIAPISDHVAKFRGDRPRDRGDLAQKKNSSKT